MPSIKLIDILYELIQEKSVPQPYDRKNARPMSRSQIAQRDKLGNAMLGNDATVRYFKKKFGDEWEDYLWATATGKVLNSGE